MDRSDLRARDQGVRYWALILSVRVRSKVEESQPALSWCWWLLQCAFAAVA